MAYSRDLMAEDKNRDVKATFAVYIKKKDVHIKNLQGKNSIIFKNYI